MKMKITDLLLASMLRALPLVLGTGCAMVGGRESPGAYAHDKEVTTRIKTAMYADPAVKGTEVSVQSLNGQVELSGFVGTQTAKERAGPIAASTPGVTQIHDDIIVQQPAPTGR